MIKKVKEYLQNREEEQLIKIITEQPEILGMQDEQGISLLMLIAYNGLPAAFEKAVGLKSSLSFHEAIVCGQIMQVKEEVEQDEGLVNSHAKDGFSSLSLAAFFRQDEIAKFLLEKGADPNRAAQNPSKVNALHAAVAKENYELCEQLIQHGADVNAPQVQKVTPLHAAVHRGNLRLMQLLLGQGADINAKMENGDTALSIAQREGHTEIVNYLNNN